ncbi:MAG: RnfABCDGE type electron transport complex subunit D [Blastocatellia bacterium]
MMTQDNWSKAIRLGGLRRFAIAITVLNVLGHTFFGFEQSVAQPLAALAAAYTLEILLELIDSYANGRAPNFSGGITNFIDFLLSAHITGLAVSMLLYTNDRIWPTVFATAVAIASKAVFRLRVGGSTRHFLNPSNFGISITLLLFPWVGIAPPYQFTENLDGVGDWVLPAVIIISGTILNARFTRKLPLIAAWLIAFVGQALLRALILGAALPSSLLPMTSVAFILYTFYMVTDPATTPSEPRAQVAFGAAVAIAYGALLVFHAVFGLFFALSIICALRGLNLYASRLLTRKVYPRVSTKATARAAAVAREV